ncbi:MAG TPA: hypothetical protein VMJ92_01945 [Candidatus Limnocylindrales bacterium]|nr:hypothetical protein [Candidatus Limnocylindrales bacterium]
MELAWAAGFFDGEGWVGAVVQAGRRTAQPVARINQAGDGAPPEALLRFQRAVGVGRIGGPASLPGRRDLYRWSVSSRGDVRSLADLIGAFLCGRKRADLAAALGAPCAPRGHLAAGEEHAWAAGFFDGEGCVSLGRHRTHAGYWLVEAAVTQLGLDDGPPPELERFRLALAGLGRIYGPYTQRSASGPVFRWRVHRAVEVRQLYDTLEPFLGEAKREQARQRLRMVEVQLQPSTRRRGSDRTSRAGRARSRGSRINA